jgi:argininosuccinate lyase
MFVESYVRRVLGPSYENWRRLLLPDFYRLQKAHLVMLAERGLITGETAAAIRRGIDEIEASFVFPEAIPDATEDLYFLFERELGRRIGADSAGRLHTARSRNDMDGAIFRMHLAGRLLEALDSVLALLRSIAGRCGGESGRSLIVLYTHGQPANVSTMGHYLSAFAMELLDDAARLSAALETVNESPMGACAITGTGFPIDRERMAVLLGFGRTVANTYGAIAGGHWLTYPAADLRAVLLDLTRLLMDLSHKASCEVGLLGFPDDLVQVSSIMPQKRNPVILEHARIQAGLGTGILSGIEELFRNAPYQDINELADAPVVELGRAVDYFVSALELAGEIVRSATVDQGRVRILSRDAGITTTELADAMVREAGLDFRTAHGLTARFVRSGGDMAALRKSFAETVGRPLPWTDAEVEDILSPERFVAVRRTPGGPAPEGMEPVLRLLDQGIAALEATIRREKDACSEADALLAKAYESL